MRSRQARSSRLSAAYRALALLAFNTLVAFLALNLIAAIVLRLSPEEPPGALAYDAESLGKAYPGRDADEVRELLTETWSRDYVYEPFTQFREEAVQGRFVNVEPAGFRRSGLDLPWPPAADGANVFVFGGSTAFGYGVADDETIPARLHPALERRCGPSVAVYNFARSNYYSSQEGILFQRLLAAGHRPRLAIFIDGLNEFGYGDDAPKFTPRLAAMMRESHGALARRWLVGLPLARLLKGWIDRPGTRQRLAVDDEMAHGVVDRWMTNRSQIRAVARDAGVATLFVWQPVPSYGYDLEHHLFADGVDEAAAIAAGYRELDARRREPANGLMEDLLWLADLQRGRAEAFYVDRVHYTAAFSTEIAERTAVRAAGMLCPPDVEGEPR